MNEPVNKPSKDEGGYKASDFLDPKKSANKKLVIGSVVGGTVLLLNDSG